MNKFYLIFCISIFSVVGLSAQSFTNYYVADGLASDIVNCVFVDHEDNVWFGTSAGISMRDVNGNWMTLSTADGTDLLDDVITAIYRTREGDLWVGTDFGLSMWDGSFFTNFTTSEGLSNNRIQDITEDPDGNLYFANRNGFDVLTSLGDWLTFGNNEGIPFGGVSSISAIESENVVLGLGLNGVAVFNLISGLEFMYTEDDNLLSNSTRAVFFDEISESIWVASAGGIDNLIDPGPPLEIENHPSVFELPPPHELNQLVDVKVDSRGIVWGGVFIDYLVDVGGITFYKDGVWTTLDVDDGLAGPVVNQLSIDSEDCVWVATSTGASKYCQESSSVSNEELGSAISIYPNPVYDFVNLEFANLKNVPKNITVFNSLGQDVVTYDIPVGAVSAQINLKDLEAGWYFVSVGNHVFRVIKD